jgi:hypothetical protein
MPPDARHFIDRDDQTFTITGDVSAARDHKRTPLMIG